MLVRCGGLIEPLFDFFEFFEDILVVEQSVREFLLEEIVLEVVLDALLDERHVEDGVDVGALDGVLLEAHLDDVFEGPAVHFGQGRVLALADLHTQLRQIKAVPGWAKCRHFVEQSAQSPYVALLVVGLLAKDFRCKVEWCANNGAGLFSRAAKHSRNPEIAQLTNAFAREENV